MNALNYVVSQVWAIEKHELEKIIEIAARMNPSVESIEASIGKPLKNHYESYTEDGVKVIPIIGPIIRYGTSFDRVSGVTSLSYLQNEFADALNDKGVESILFKIDSGGGEANGINEFAELIHSARDKKPITAYVSNMACSAAYWIASAADRIVIDETACLGSIGCVAVVNGEETAEGKKPLIVVSSRAKNKRPDPETDEGMAIFQSRVDSIENVFVDKVHRNLSDKGLEFTADEMIAKFNYGGVLIGKNAVSVGLADELGSFDTVLQTLQKGVTPANLEKNMSETKKVTTSKVDEEIDAGATEDKTVLETGTIVKSVAPIVKESAIDNAKLSALESQNAEMQIKLDAYEKSVKVLQDQHVKLENDAIQSKAESVAANLGNKIVPAQKDDFIAGYVRAAQDDKALPVEGFNRVENYVKVWEAKTDHNLTKETLADKTILSSEKETYDEEAAELLALDNVAKEYAKKMNAAGK